MADSVNNDLPYTTVGATYQATTRQPTQELGKDDFLKLMITQLQNQDPLNPTDNTEQLAQQAQFTQLEQIQNLNASMEKLISIYQSGNRSNIISMIGKEVVGVQTVPSEEEDGEDTEMAIQGLVRSVDFSNGEANVVVETQDGEFLLSMDEIQAVRIYQPQAETE